MEIRDPEVAKLADIALHAGYFDGVDALTKLATLEHREQAIPVFVEHARQTGRGSAASQGLEAIGTPAVIEPLLEVLRTVKPARIEKDGSIPDGESGEDGAPAASLVRLPGALERLKSICAPAEFERILVRAHDYKEAGNPEVNAALGEIGSSKAIGRLASCLWQSQWDAEKRRPAREALVKVGKKAHGRLLELLKTQSTNRQHITILRREVLAVLRETGDDECAAAIRTVMESDASVAGDARAALEAISKRCAGVEAPEAVVAKARALTTVAKTGDPYIDDCLQLDFEEFDEGRLWGEMPEAKAIPQAANAGQTDEALHLAQALRDKHPDFHFAYRWLNYLYRKQGRLADARNAALAGLRLSKSKYDLCQVMADTEWEQGNLPEAVKWWLRSVMIQAGTKSLGDFASFLYLSYVAERSGLADTCSRL